MIKRYSSRRDEIFSSLLEPKLKNAKSYDRIAGYFSSSILEIAGESIENVSGKVRIVCNSDLEIEDVQTAQLAANGLRREWCEFKPEEIPSPRQRFRRLYEFLMSGKIEVRVLPKRKFGLAHGKAGVITLEDGSKTTFLGSINESYSGWKLNYELVWEDDSEEAIKWVTEEFEALWNDPCAVLLSDFVISDIGRISKRIEIDSIGEWKEKEGADPASIAVESNIYRNSFGLWEHQKYFIDKAFSDHKKRYGAHYVLADQVGLGKTAQLALSAELMALYGNKPVLVIVPKTLMEQWQNELNDLLNIPSAIWKNCWIDENGIEYPLGIMECPRKIGIISQGIINNSSESCKVLQSELLNGTYECIIVDEAHRARRKNTGVAKVNKSPDMNYLYKFLYQISSRTHSMLLATATPVQIHPVEAFDLLNILSNRNDSVLGNQLSEWRKRPQILKSLNLITGTETIDDENAYWEWVRNPLPPEDEKPTTFGRIRSEFNIKESQFVCNIPLTDFSRPLRSKFENIMEDDFFRNNNPYIRHIIRRERAALETKLNPETGQPYLKRINVVLLGEDSSGSLALQNYLADAYESASEFCRLIQKRNKAGGFLKTLLLKRIGSSMAAGLKTGRKMLNEWILYDGEDDDDEEIYADDIKDLTPEETKILRTFVSILETAIGANEQLDPKYKKICEILSEGVILSSGKKSRPWKDIGCIIFSQYFDSADWVAKNISNTYLDEIIGLYAGGDKSGLYLNGIKTKETKVNIKKMVKDRKIKILVGTDAASEGLNLQTLGSLINLDLPWNPTRLEQRKGRIQRIGQEKDEVYIFNLKYKDSVEDRVHELLSSRMHSIYEMFGQIPDVLEDAWVDVAMGNIENAKKRINELPQLNPFALKYHESVRSIDWENCNKVLRSADIRRQMMYGWK